MLPYIGAPIPHFDRRCKDVGWGLVRKQYSRAGNSRKRERKLKPDIYILSATHD